MKKYCSNCGKELTDTVKFCPVCGKLIENNFQSDIVKSQKSRRNTRVIAAILILVIILCGTGGFVWYKKNHEINTVSEAQSDVGSTEKPAGTKTVAEDNIISKTQKILDAKLDRNGTVIASTLGHSGNGFLAIINNNGEYGFVINDEKNHQIAEVPFSFKTYNFYLNKDGKYLPPVIFNMDVLTDNTDDDMKLGQWSGPNHIIPIYAVFKLDQYNNILPGMLTSAQGLTPSHYQAHLKEQKNVDTANLFLTEMKTLHQYVEDNKVSVPVTQ